MKLIKKGKKSYYSPPLVIGAGTLIDRKSKKDDNNLDYIMLYQTGSKEILGGVTKSHEQHL